MTKIRTSKTKRLNEILSIVKLFSLLFSGIGLYVSIYNQSNNLTSIITPVSFMVVLAIIYIIWLNFSVRNISENKINMVWEIENYLLILIFCVVIYYSGAYESKNKYLFLFIIITATIQQGMKKGLFVAIISASLILGMDLVTASELQINTYFEADLVLAAVFIVLAWLVGHYASIEKEYFERLESLAHTDELTGLYNHRFFYDSLREHIRHNKGSRPLSMIFLDVDSFKYYNDLFGHQKGDNVLIEISKVLLSNVNKTDIVARYAGDEFAILMPDVEEQEAIVAAERIRDQVEATHFDGQENMPDHNLTVSVGVSVYPHKAESERALVKSADDALYRAKFFNKNRVEVYTSTLDALKDDIEEEHIDLLTSMKTLITIINSKDRYTYGHVERVVIYSKMFADHLKLTEDEKNTLVYGAYMHDLGKINIPEEILNKQMPLTQEEWLAIKAHPENGVKIVEPVATLRGTIPIIMHHHERYDGRGYPSGLKGENIPYLARVMMLIDAFDAMTFQRSYNDKKSLEEAVEEIRVHSGTQFDPVLADAFIEMISVSGIAMIDR